MLSEVNLIAPPEEFPVPEIVIGSATVIPPEISRAPAVTVVPCPDAYPPNAVALLIAKVPAEIDVVPVYVLAFDNVNLLDPDFVNETEVAEPF